MADATTCDMYEDRTPIWPGKREAYPWRFETEPVIVLEESQLVPAEPLAPALEHVRKWPPEHWTLAFQGELRPVSAVDARLLEGTLRDALHPAPVRG